MEWVANALRIKPAFIHAIERGDLQDLPGTAYAVGFVRTYAIALGLDANEAIRRFKAEREEVTHKTDLVFPAPAPQRGVPAGALVLVGAVIVIAGYIGWLSLLRPQRTHGFLNRLPARPSGASGATAGAEVRSGQAGTGTSEARCHAGSWAASAE